MSKIVKHSTLPPFPTRGDKENWMLSPNIGHQGHWKPMHLFTQTAEVVLFNSTTETSMASSSSIGSMILPANHFSYVGEPLTLMVMGTWKHEASSDLTLRIKITPDGGSTTTLHQKIFPTAKIGTKAGNSGHWEITMSTVCFGIGAGGSIQMHGMLQMLENTSAEIEGIHTENLLYSLNTTIAHTIHITAQWSTLQGATNTITSTILVMH